MKECSNFYPSFGTGMFLKWLRQGRLRQEDVDKAKQFVDMQDRTPVTAISQST